MQTDIKNLQEEFKNKEGAGVGTTNQVNQGSPAQESPDWKNGPLYAQCENSGPSQGCVDAFFHLQGSTGRLLYNCQEGDLAWGNTTLNLQRDTAFPSADFPNGVQCGEPEEPNLITFNPTDYSPLCHCVLEHKEIAEANKEANKDIAEKEANKTLTGASIRKL